jgi:hypothetical protein
MTKLGDITLTKQTGTTLTLNTGGKYVTDNVFFDLDVISGTVITSITSADASIASDANPNNISSVIGVKSSSMPASGYYFKVTASGAGTSTITVPGWLGAGSIDGTPVSSSYYFPVQAATATATGTNTVTPTTSLSGTNVVLSNLSNGISVTATGGGTASASFSATTTTAGFLPSGTQIASGTADASSTTTSASLYISSVTVPVPASGTNVFTVYIPNGVYDPIPLEITVDASGNSNVFSDGSITLRDVYPVNSLYATESSTANPAVILGFGTWVKVAPKDLTWNDADQTWNDATGVTSGFYVWKRTA